MDVGSSAPKGAVFLSYASQDAEAAKRIADALRAAGVEVWFDQSELVGGDAWDAKIRKQIKDCALLIPIISANTQARTEGYFRLEWRLADQRTHLMARGRPFLLPVVIDGTRDAEAHVPDSFTEVQWTRLPGGEGGNAFAARVQKLLRRDSGNAGVVSHPDGPDKSGYEARFPDKRWILPLIIAGVAVLVVAGVLAQKFLQRDRLTEPMAAAPAGPSSLLSEAQKLERQARALIDVEPLAVRETYRTAYQLCEKAAALSPGDAEAWATMARANVVLIGLYQEGGTEQVAAARSQAEKALSLAPDSIEAGLAMAAVDLELLAVDPLAVRARLEVLSRRAPDDHRIWLLLAQTEDADTVSETAFRWLARAEALPAGKAAAALRQAWIYWGANHLRQSLEAVERSLAAQPLSEAYHLKLMLLKTMGENEVAEAWLKRIPPLVLREDRAAMIAYETLYFARKPEEALRVLQAVPREVLEEGRFFDIRALLAAEALLMAGKTNAAEVELRAALKVIDARLAANPRHGRLWHAKGRTLFHLGDRAGAERCFSTAAELGGLREIELAAQAMLLGRNEDTLALIDRALNRQLTRWPSWLHYFKLHPVFDPLRSYPRYRQLLARAEAWLAEDLQRPPAGAATVGQAGIPADAPAKADDKSVAVLAFANLSDDKANEYFSDGISEELLNVLAKVPGLKVSARTSAFYFKGKEVPVPEIAKQLGVAYVVEGSVRKAGDKVRITAQLIKAADGFHVWSDTFTRDLKDIFAVQDEIAGLIAQNLSLKLGTSSVRKVAAVNPQAFELYVQARQAWSLRTPEGFARAEQMLNRALELAPDFVRARAALIDVVQMRSLRERKVGAFGQRHSSEIDQRLAQVRAVLAIDPDLAEAYSTLGQALDSKWQRDEAGQAYQRATELNPNYATGRHWYGMHLAELGRMDEALAEVKAACDLDPFSFIILDNYGWLLNLAGRNREAVQMLDRAAALNPGFDQTARAKAAALAALGRTAEARAIARQLKNLQRELDVWTLGLVGLHDEARALLQRMEPRDITNRFQALLAAGQREAALAALADPSGASKGDSIDTLFQPIYDPVRTDPRFIQYLATLGLNDAHSRAQAWRKAHPPERPATGQP